MLDFSCNVIIKYRNNTFHLFSYFTFSVLHINDDDTKTMSENTGGGDSDYFCEFSSFPHQSQQSGESEGEIQKKTFDGELW